MLGSVRVGQNFRRYERYPSTLTVQVTGDGTTRFGTIYEISLGGAFLEVSPLPEVGANVTVVVTLPAGRFVFQAEVRYYASGLSGPRGMEGVGVAWLSPGAPEQAILADFVERARSGRPLRDPVGEE